MTDNEVHEDFIVWLSAETGLTVIKAHEGGARPATPYLMVNFLNSRELHENIQELEFVETANPNSEGELEIVGNPVMEVEWEFSLHSYGDDPTTPLRFIRSIRHLQQRLEPLLPGLIFHKTGTLNNVPDWINNSWEPRSHMNVFIRGIIRDGAVIDVIDNASVSVSRA